MRDPHVQKLHYKVGSGEGISYRDPEPIAFSNHLGAFELRDDSLSIAPAEHFADEDEARHAVEPFLRAWEIEADLKSNIGMIRFKFDRSDVVDRDPPPPGESVIQVKTVSSMVCVTDSLTVHQTLSTYPQPPKTFRTTPEVEIAYRRWVSFRGGKEPLQSMAYFVLTLLERNAGNRRKAAQTFQIDLPVLSTIGKLSSTKGDESTARKAAGGNQFEGLTGPEREWLEAAVRRVIHRLGEHALGSPLTLITLTDLPTL